MIPGEMKYGKDVADKSTTANLGKALVGVVGEPLKEMQPIEAGPINVIFVGLANGAEGYMPTTQAYARGGYERDACRYGPDIGDEATQTPVDTLKKFKQSDAQRQAE